MSHPAWDAWIEMSAWANQLKAIKGRIPHGMRGLKYAITSFVYDNKKVASRMGCVD